MSLYNSGQKLLAGLFLLFFLSACATPQQSIQLNEFPPDIPVSIELTTTPFYAQRDYQCGPAALATVINYHQLKTTPDELIPLVYIPRLKGSLQIEMLAATRRFDRLAILQDGKLESVLKEVAHGNPVLVMQNLGFAAFPFWHYAVVIGYDLEKKRIILRSGEIKRLVRPFSVFERTWQRSDYWSVVVVPPGEMPITASEQSYSHSAITLEPYTSLQNSVLSYQTGINRWPQNFILNMGLGNVLFALKDYAKAEAAFTRATQLMPKRAEAWNNLAYSRFKLGKLAEASEAVQRAVEIDPENKEYQGSQREINNR